MDNNNFDNKMNLYTVNGGEKVINSADFKSGELLYEIDGNLRIYYVIKNGVVYKLEEGEEWLINTFVLRDSKWIKVGHKTNPYLLILDEVINKGDIVRFTNDLDPDNILGTVPELHITDPYGIFIVSETIEDFSNRLQEELDEDDECDESEELSFISASYILEYLRCYGNSIEIAGSVIDEIEGR